MNKLFKYFYLFTLLLISSATHSDNHNSEEKIVLNWAYAKETNANRNVSSAYVSLNNLSKTDDKLIKIISSFTRKSELHQMTFSNNVMKMRKVENIIIKAGQKFEMNPKNGFHIMFFEIDKPLKSGEEFPITLVFMNAGKISTTMKIVKKIDFNNMK